MWKWQSFTIKIILLDFLFLMIFSFKNFPFSYPTPFWHSSVFYWLFVSFPIQPIFGKSYVPLKKGGVNYIYFIFINTSWFWAFFDISPCHYNNAARCTDLKGAYRRTTPSTVDFCQTQNCKKKSAFFCIVWTRTQEQNKKSTQMIL